MDLENLIIDLHSPILGTKMVIEYMEDLLGQNAEMSRDELQKIHALTIIANSGIDHIENIRQEYRTNFIKEFEQKHPQI